MEDIHKEARIAKGTFYEYFKNKEELFIALLVKFLEDWEEAVLDTTTNLVMEDIRTYYRTLIKRSLVFFQSNEDLCNIYLRVGPGTDEVFEPYIEQFEDKMLQYVKNDLDRGVEPGPGVLEGRSRLSSSCGEHPAGGFPADRLLLLRPETGVEKESRDLDGSNRPVLQPHHGRHLQQYTGDQGTWPHDPLRPGNHEPVPSLQGQGSHPGGAGLQAGSKISPLLLQVQLLVYLVAVKLVIDRRCPAPHPASPVGRLPPRAG
ncbi:MAG: TetR/AcrR family transcriptional regulator [Desulfosudis oleivorans]|nr:TetR/AcrR family transcriptional regulator [Desulfosudis oleivorans]